VMRQAISPVVVQRDEGKTARQRKRESENTYVIQKAAKDSQISHVIQVVGPTWPRPPMMT